MMSIKWHRMTTATTINSDDHAPLIICNNMESLSISPAVSDSMEYHWMGIILRFQSKLWSWVVQTSRGFVLVISGIWCGTKCVIFCVHFKEKVNWNGVYSFWECFIYFAVRVILLWVCVSVGILYAQQLLIDLKINHF